MSTISFNVLAHDLASRTFRSVGNAAMAMAAKIRAADALAGRVGGYVRHNRALVTLGNTMRRTAPLIEALQRGLARLTGDNIRGQGRFWFRLFLASMAMAPAVLGPAIYAIGALAGAIVAVTPGAGALSLAMFGVWKRIKQATESAKAFSRAAPSIQRAANAFKHLNTAYQSFLNKTQGPVGDVFTQLFKGASELLPKLVPMTNRFARVFSRFLAGVRQEMKSPAFDRALNWLKRVGSITFKNILTSGENLIKFFYNLSRAFQNAGIDIKGGWLVKFTDGLNKWAKDLKHSKGFKDLIDFTKENWPKITRILGNLGETLGNITRGMEPIASKGLDALVKITDKLAEIKPETWTKIAKGFIAFAAAVKVLGIALAGLRIAGLLRLVGGLSAAGGTGAATGAGLRAMGGGLLALAKGLGAIGATIWVASKLGKLLDQFAPLGPDGLPVNPNKPGDANSRFPGMQMPGIVRWFATLRNKLPKLEALTIPIRLIPKLITGGNLDFFGPIGRALRDTATKVITISFRILGLAPVSAALAWLNKFKNKHVALTFAVPGLALLLNARRIYQWFKSKPVRLTILVPGLALLANARRIYQWFKSKPVRLTFLVPGLALLRGAQALYRWFKPKRVALNLAVIGVGLVRAARTLWAWFKGKHVALTLLVPGIGLVRAAKALWEWFKSKNVLLSLRVAGMGAVAAAKALWNSIQSKTAVLTTLVRKVIDKVVPGGRAAGGTVNRSTPYIVGEQGPELMVPESSGRIIPNHRLGQYAQGGGDTYVVNVTGALDPVAVGREVQKALLALKRTNGGRALGLA